VLRADVRPACGPEPAAAAAAAAVEDDAERVMLADDADDVAVVVALSACSVLWCCCAQTPVAESDACPGQNAYPQRHIAATKTAACTK